MRDREKSITKPSLQIRLALYDSFIFDALTSPVSPGAYAWSWPEFQAHKFGFLAIFQRLILKESEEDLPPDFTERARRGLLLAMLRLGIWTFSDLTVRADHLIKNLLR